MNAQIMGIINATPDSFYDGDPKNNLPALLAKCREYVAEGADILDIGGESTRPSAAPVSEEEEQSRVLPLIRAVKKEFPQIPVSLDTYKISTALAGLQAGASIINDISGTPDKEMFKLVKDFNATLVLMHMRGTPQTMTEMTDYTDLITEVKDFLYTKTQEALSYGIKKENIWLDPGFGFAKNRTQNYQLLKHLQEFKTLGHPILAGLSRKSFLSQKCEKPPKRKAQTLAAQLVALQNGADILRVHDVRDSQKIRDFWLELQAAL